MKDYSNYHELTMKQKIISDGNVVFKAQLTSEGLDATVDSLVCRILIHSTTNVISERKEERKILVLDEIDLKRGSLVVAENKTYLVVTKVESNKVYKVAKMIETNHLLKIKTDDGVINIIPSVITRSSVTTLGTNDTHIVTLPEGKLELQIPNNAITNQITRNKHNRFIIDGIAWKVSFIDKSTKKGMIDLLLDEDMIDTEKDDKVNDIAHIDIIEPIPQEQSLITITGKDRVKIGNSQTYSATVDASLTLNGLLWYITGTDGVTITDLATIKNQSGNNCEIETNGNFEKGRFYLWVKDTDNTIATHYKIDIVSRF